MEKQQTDPAQEGSQPNSAMHRKTHVGKADHQARAMSLPKALRVSLAKVAEEQLEMAMAVIGVRRQTCAGDDLEEVIDGNVLLMLLDGPDRRRGAAVFDSTFVGGMIQQQTMGQVLPVLDGDTRKMTVTDAAICAPFLEDLLGRAGPMPEEADQRQLVEGFTFGAHCEEARVLMLALDEPEYEVLHLTVDMAGGARQGKVTLCFPVVTSLTKTPDVTEANTASDERAGPQPSTMERTVLGLNVELNIALARIRLPLSGLQSIAAGDVLDLKVNSFEKAVVQTRDGRRLGRGKLGQVDGVRAVQLEHAPSPFNAPRRRAADRADIDLPNVDGDGTGTQGISGGTAMMQLPPASLPDIPAMPDMPAMAEMPGTGDLPDLPGDLPDMGGGMEAVSGLPDLPDMPAMGDLPDISDLPDLSELPGLSDDDMPEMSIT